jgi:hypothetical protein
MATRLPKGFREGHSGDLACPHRDVSCCAVCAAAHPEIVEVYGQHFWVPSAAERTSIAVDMATAKVLAGGAR